MARWLKIALIVSGIVAGWLALVVLTFDDNAVDFWSDKWWTLTLSARIEWVLAEIDHSQILAAATEYGALLEGAVDKGCSWKHESGTYVKFT
jgi:hypothetical protein